MKTKLFVVLLAMLAGFSAQAVGPFALPWMNHSMAGTTYYSLDYPDAIFVIEAYYRGCSACNANAPSVDKLAERYKNSPRVQVLDVGIDFEDTEYQMWIQTHNPNHPVLKDYKKQVVGPLGTQKYPSTYVLDCSGKVHYSSVGTWDASTQQAIQTAIDKLNNEICYPMVVTR